MPYTKSRHHRPAHDAGSTPPSRPEPNKSKEHSVYPLEPRPSLSTSTQLPWTDTKADQDVETAPKSPGADSSITLVPRRPYDTDGHSIPWTPTLHDWLVMVTLSCLSFAVSLDATILVTAMPKMALELHGSAAETFWTGTSYLLTSAVFQPVIAASSQIFGSRQLLFLSVTLFTVGTAFCAVAQNFAVMLTGRSIQGVGGGGIITMTQVMFAAMIPLRQRPKYFSLVLGSWSIGSIVGPVVGGALAEHASWRGCFNINIPFCIVGMGATLRYVRPGKIGSLTLRQRIRQMDWAGAVLFVGGTTALLIGISWGGTQHAWASAGTLTPIIVGMLSIDSFAAWQVYFKPYTLLPTSLFQSATLAAAFYCAFLNGFILCTALYYVSFYQIAVRGSSPTRAGADLLPAVCLLVPGSLIVARLTSHFGRYRWSIWLGWVVTTAGCGMLIPLNMRTTKAVFAATLAIFGVGSGMLLTGVNIAVQAASCPQDQTMAACMYGFMRSLGMSVGVALSGSIFQNTMSRSLSSSGLPVKIAEESERFVHVLQAMAETDPRKVAILESYTKGFQGVFIAMTALSASGLLMSVAIKGHGMDAAHAEEPRRL